MSFNKIILVGNLGRDPELRYTPAGVAVCTFSMATNERKRNPAGEYEDNATWFKVTLWRQQAENAAKYLSKGSPVYIEGRLRIDEWTDRENNNRFTLEVNGSDMQFIGSRESETNEQYAGRIRNESCAIDSFPSHSGPATPDPASGSITSQPTLVTQPNDPDDDIPF